MLVKQVSLAALVATVIAGSSVVARAESNIHGEGVGATGAFTSGTMQDDEAARQTGAFRRTQGTLPDEGGPRWAGGYGYAWSPIPTLSPGYGSYGYAQPKAVHHPKMKRSKSVKHKSK